MNNRKARSCLLILMVTAGFCWWLPAQKAQATTTTFSQKILPLDCVFQEVNDGTGTLIYLTPAECGVILNPPTGNGSGSQPSQPSDTNKSAVAPLQYLKLNSPPETSAAGQLPLSQLVTGVGTPHSASRDVQRSPERESVFVWWALGGGITVAGVAALRWWRQGELTLSRYRKRH